MSGHRRIKFLMAVILFDGICIYFICKYVCTCVCVMCRLHKCIGNETNTILPRRQGLTTSQSCCSLSIRLCPVIQPVHEHVLSQHYLFYFIKIHWTKASMYNPEYTQDTLFDVNYFIFWEAVEPREFNFSLIGNNSQLTNWP